MSLSLVCLGYARSVFAAQDTPTASAAPILQPYADRTAFTAASANLTTIDFEGIAPAGKATLYGDADGLTLSGVRFTGVTASGNGYQMYVASASEKSDRNWGTGDTLVGDRYFYSGNNDVWLSAVLPPGMTAVGMDFMTAQGGAKDSFPCEFRVHTKGGGQRTFNRVSKTNGPAFIGFTSNIPITRIDFRAGTVAMTGEAAPYGAIDNFAFGLRSGTEPTHVNAVPTDATFHLESAVRQPLRGILHRILNADPHTLSAWSGETVTGTPPAPLDLSAFPEEQRKRLLAAIRDLRAYKLAMSQAFTLLPPGQTASDARFTGQTYGRNVPYNDGDAQYRQIIVAEAAALAPVAILPDENLFTSSSFSFYKAAMFAKADISRQIRDLMTAAGDDYSDVEKRTLLASTEGIAWVGTGTSAPYQTLHDAVQNATAGGLILLEPGTYTSNENLTIPLMIAGMGKPADTVINASPHYPDFFVSNIFLSVNSLTLHAKKDDNFRIACLILMNKSILDAYNVELQSEDCIADYFSATGSDPSLLTSSLLKFTDCRIAGASGIQMDNGKHVVLRAANCVLSNTPLNLPPDSTVAFDNCTASDTLEVKYANVTVRDCDLATLRTLNANTTIFDSEIANLAVYKANVSLIGTTLKDSRCTESKVAMTDCTLNTGTGGKLFLDGTDLHLRDVHVKGNKAFLTREGGDSTIQATDCTVEVDGKALPTDASLTPIKPPAAKAAPASTSGAKKTGSGANAK